MSPFTTTDYTFPLILTAPIVLYCKGMSRYDKIVTESDYRGEPNSNKMESTVQSYVMRSTKVKKLCNFCTNVPYHKQIKRLLTSRNLCGIYPENSGLVATSPIMNTYHSNLSS